MGEGIKVLLSPSPPYLPLDACSISEASCALSTHTLASLTSPFEQPPPPRQARPQPKTDSEFGVEEGGQFPAHCLQQGFLV